MSYPLPTREDLLNARKASVRVNWREFALAAMAAGIVMMFPRPKKTREGKVVFYKGAKVVFYKEGTDEPSTDIAPIEVSVEEVLRGQGVPKIPGYRSVLKPADWTPSKGERP